MKEIHVEGSVLTRGTDGGGTFDKPGECCRVAQGHLAAHGQTQDVERIPVQSHSLHKLQTGNK